MLALASLLFFKYSIEHGLIPPAVRVALGLAAGIACIFGSEWLRPRRQPAAANSLAGAGVVVLYASLWAAMHLYHLINMYVAFGAMALVTVACGVLAHRHGSLLIAVLGLLGGFATPLLVGTVEDRPLALFSYVLLLDAGLLWLARRRRWPVLALLGLAGTALFQGLWILDQMGPSRVLLGLAVLAVFAVAFLLLGERREEAHPLWRLTRAGGVLLPFTFALYFAGKADLGEHLAPLAVLMVMLSFAACWVARSQPEPLLAPAAAAGTLGVVVVWFGSHRPSGAIAWEAVAACLALAATYTVSAELEHRRSRGSILAVADLISSSGLMAVLVIACTGRRVDAVWPWLAGWLVLAALLVRHARRTGRAPAQLLAGPGAAAGLVLFVAAHATSHSPAHPAALLLALAIGLAVLLQVVALLGGDARARRWAEHAAAAGALILLLAVVAFVDTSRGEPLLYLGAAAALGLLAALAATRLRAGPWYLIAVVCTALVQSLWTLATDDGGANDPSNLLRALVVQALTVVVMTGWPAWAAGAFAASRTAWVGAALAGPLWFLSLGGLWERLFGDDLIAALPLALAVVTLATALRARRVWPEGDGVRTSALVWLLAVTLSLVSIAIPLQLEKQWITIGWALNGLAVIALWRRLDHPGLKYFGLALLGAATVRLVANPAVLSYLPRGPWPVVNWLLYTYLVPAAALVTSGALLARYEVPRLRPWVQRLAPAGKAWGSPACGLAAIVVVFVWINLAIADLFAVGDRLVLDLERMPARDLTTSIAWACYALVLLALGVRRSSSALRWLSLALMLVTLAKVFLHDLGQLEDLYRVASFFGLAVSLILVSLVYQRFVLGAKTPEDEEE